MTITSCFRISWLLILATFSYSALAASTVDNVEVKKAEIFLPQVGSSATGSKMTIYNRTDKPLVIEKVQSDAFKKVMLHKTKFVEGKRIMYQVPSLTVPAHQQLALTPNTAHIMVMGFIHPLNKGDLVSLTLITNQGNVPIIARIVPMRLR